MVPCTGLYADVAADLKQGTEALEQNVIKGNLCFREDFLPVWREFLKLTISTRAIVLVFE